VTSFARGRGGEYVDVWSRCESTLEMSQCIAVVQFYILGGVLVTPSVLPLASSSRPVDPFA
jgi:hypothetical protein